MSGIQIMHVLAIQIVSYLGHLGHIYSEDLTNGPLVNGTILIMVF